VIVTDAVDCAVPLLSFRVIVYVPTPAYVRDTVGVYGAVDAVQFVDCGVPAVVVLSPHVSVYAEHAGTESCTET